MEDRDLRPQPPGPGPPPVGDPTPGSPEVRFPGVRGICHTRPSPHLLSGFFLTWLREKFLRPERLPEEFLRGLLWSNTPQTQILIAESTDWDPERTERRPALLIAREEWKTERLALGDRTQGRYDLTIGDHHANLLQGAHTVLCVASLGSQVERLAWEVFTEFNDFGPVIRQALGLARFRVPALGKPQKREEARESITVTITLEYGFSREWLLRPHVPVLKRLALRSGNR